MAPTPGAQGSSGDHSDLGKPLIILAWTLFAVATIIVALRIWTRLFYLKTRLMLHDWLILCAIISEILHATLLTLAQQHGLGRHIWTLQGPSISKAGHYMLISESFSIITSYFGRMSFAAFLLSVLGKTAKVRRYILFSLIAVDTAINILVAIQTYSQCGKYLSALWNPALAAVVHCQAADVATYIGYCQASINSLCDLTLTIIPITIVTKLKLPRSTKLGLGALLTLSLFAFLASIAKGVELRQLSNGPDFTYNFAVLQFSVVMENDVVVIAGSVPMLRALWLKNAGSDFAGARGGAIGGPPYYYTPGGGSSSADRSRKSARSKPTTTTLTFGSGTGGLRSLADDEEYMLADRVVPPPRRAHLGGIKRTTEMDVSVVVEGPEEQQQQQQQQRIDSPYFK